jgi:hypothetical protein
MCEKPVVSGTLRVLLQAMVSRHYQQSDWDVGHRCDCLQQTIAAGPGLGRNIMHRYA